MSDDFSAAQSLADRGLRVCRDSLINVWSCLSRACLHGGHAFVGNWLASDFRDAFLVLFERHDAHALLFHLTEQVLEPKVPVKRAVFHEITQEALFKAFEVRVPWLNSCWYWQHG